MTFSDPVGSAKVTIEPDLSRFGAELQAKVAASVAAVNRTVTGVRLNPFAEMERGAASAAGIINNRTAPAVKKLSDSFRGGLKGFGGDLFSGLVDGAQKGTGALSGLSGAFTGAGGAAGASAAGMGAAVTALQKVAEAALKVEFAFAAVVTTIGIKAASNIENMTVALGGLSRVLGTTAADALAKISDFAARTPFSLNETTDSVIKLASAFQLRLGPSLDVLAIIGDATAAAGKLGAEGSEAIRRVVVALTQIGSKGRLTAQDLNQISEALPNIVQADVFARIGVALGKTATEAKDLADQGLIPAGVAIKAILASAQGVDGAMGAMARGSKTFSGELSTLHDNVNILLGNAFLPVIKVIGEQFTPLLSANSAELKRMGDELGRELVPLFKLLIPVALEVAKAFVAFNIAMLKLLPTTIATVKNIGAAVSVVVDGLNVLTHPADLSRLKSFFGDFGEFGDNMKATGADAKGLSDILGNAFADIKVPDFPTLDGPIVKTIDDVSASIASLFSASTSLAGANRSEADANRSLIATRAELAKLMKEGGEEERAAAARDLASAIDNVADAQGRHNTALARLAELEAPASADELSEATDKVTRAELALAKATRLRDEALKALEPHEKSRLNLQGLSLDALRATLANERATLAAQRVSKEAGKSAAELAEDATSAEIDQRDAVRLLAEARAKLADLEQKGTKPTEELVKARRDVASTERDVGRALDDQEGARRKLAEIEAGHSKFADALAAARDKVSAAEGRVADAIDAAKRADLEYQHQLGLSAGTKDADLKYYKGLFDLLKSTGDLKPEAQRVVQGIFDSLTAAVAAHLQIATDLAGRLIIKPSLVGPALPGFAEGGLIDRPTLAHLGEKFRHELVVPLQDPARAWSLLSEHLPKYLPGFAPTVLATPERPRLNLTRPTGGPSQGTAAGLTEEQLTRAVKTAVLEALKEAGPTASGDIHVHPHAGMSEEALVRKVKREMTRYWQ